MRLSYLLMGGAVGFLALAEPANASTRTEIQQAKESRQFTVTNQHHDTRNLRPIHTIDESRLGSGQSETSIGRPLGRVQASTGAASIGATLLPTYEDWFYSQKGRSVEWTIGNDGITRIHFVASNKTTTTATSDGRYWYNYYDATNGIWPLGIGTGSGHNVQPPGSIGLWPNAAFNPNNGQVVMYGSDNLPPFGNSATAFFQNKLHFQDGDGSTSWGVGQSIPPSQYELGDPIASTMQHPQIDINVVGNDTVIHVLAHTNFSNHFTNLSGSETIGLYFRRVLDGSIGCGSWGDNGGDTACWSGPVTIDTMGYRGTLSASQVSAKVGIAWLRPTAEGFAEDNPADQDVWFIESLDGGVTWEPKLNVTNYDRQSPNTIDNAAPFIETHSLYSSDDQFHLLWNAIRYPPGVYDSTSQPPSDFSASIYHWSSGTMTKSYVVDADWGLQFSIPVCGFGGTNALYVSFFSISECDGNLYAIWSQTHEVVNRGNTSDPANILDDCASGLPPGSNTSGVNDDIFRANHELWMSVSTTLDGLAWDQARNLSQTYTPGCDSVGFGGICLSEKKATMSRYGQDITGLNFTDPIAAAAELDPTGSYTGSHNLHIMYLLDFYPGEGQFGRGPVTLNEMRWVRLACVDPVLSPIVSIPPTNFELPDFVRHGEQIDIPISILNIGNTPLVISPPVFVPSGLTPANAVGTDQPSGLTVDYRPGLNTGSLTIQVNPGGIINSPGTVVDLTGTLTLPNNSENDSLVPIEFRSVIADTVIEIEFDTITAANTELLVSSIGGFGLRNVTSGGVHLDYVNAPVASDCDPTAVRYVLDAGPFIITNVTGTPSYSTALYNQSISGETTFYRIPGSSPASIAGETYDGYITGIFVNQDSTIGMLREWYAPDATGQTSNSAQFVVSRTRYFNLTGMPLPNILIGEIVDWHLSVRVGENSSNYGRLNRGGQTGDIVYLTAVDSLLPNPGCPSRVSRLAASTVLSWYSSQAFQSDSCVSNQEIGQYSRITFGEIETGAFGNGNVDSLLTNIAATGLSRAFDTTPAFQHITTVFGTADPAELTTGFTLATGDTLVVDQAYATVKNGTTTDLRAALAGACAWYSANLRPGCSTCGCCVGSVGDVNCDDAVGLPDLSALIDHLFISLTPLCCADESDIDANGQVGLPDISSLVDHLFITFTPLAACP